MLSTAVKELGRVMGVSRCFIRYFQRTPQGENTSHLFEYQSIT